MNHSYASAITRKRLALASLFSAMAFLLPAAMAAESTAIFGESYQPVGTVVPEQAQVVFFRGETSSKQAAHVYLDGSLQTGLMPGGYTTFCVLPGRHSLESYVGDEPLYAGKRAPKVQADFEGGKTYFLQVPDDATESTPKALARTDAEAQLTGKLRQVHLVDRSDAIQPCKTLQETQFSLQGDVLFRFAKSSYEDITEQGRAELAKVADAIKSQPFAVESVEVNGYADPIGSKETNLRLSQERAQTVRRVLLDLGVRAETVHATGHGSANPVVNCGKAGSLKERAACNAPNRRVDIVMRGVKVER